MVPFGTNLNLFDDDNELVALPFVFSYYGMSYNSIYVVSNGFLSFTDDSTAFSNDPIPSTDFPNNLLAPLWGDLNPSCHGFVYYNVFGTKALIVCKYYNQPKQ